MYCKNEHEGEILISLLGHFRAYSHPAGVKVKRSRNKQKYQNTRMHSSKMRTGRSLTVCWRLLPGGDLLPGGRVSARGVGWGCLQWGGGIFVFHVRFRTV